MREGCRRERRRRRRVANRCCWRRPRLVLSRRSKRAVEHRQRSCDHVVLHVKFLHVRRTRFYFREFQARAKYSRNKDEENRDISYRILLQSRDENTEQVRASSINIDQSPTPFLFTSLQTRYMACRKMYYKIVYLFQRFQRLVLLYFAKGRM